MPHLQEKLLKMGNHSGIRVRVGEKPVVPDACLALRKYVWLDIPSLIEKKPCWGLDLSTLVEGIPCDLAEHLHP